MRVNYAIVIVSGMERSVIFYRDVLGMALRFQSPHWTEFMTKGAALALHLSDAPATADDPGLEPAGRFRLGLQVPDRAAFHARMREHQVRCVQEPKLTFGSLIAQYLDPDGLMIGVSQARSAPWTGTTRIKRNEAR